MARMPTVVETRAAVQDVVARAAIRAVQLANEGKAPSKYWSIEQKDIVRLGRTEWPEKPAPETETPAAQ